jgi:hypothetical protein
VTSITVLLLSFGFVYLSPQIIGAQPTDQTKSINALVKDFTVGVLQSAQTFNVNQSNTATVPFESPEGVDDSTDSKKVVKYQVKMTDGDDDLAQLIQLLSKGDIHSVNDKKDQFGLGMLLNDYYQTYLNKSYAQVKNNATLQLQAMKDYINDRYNGSTAEALSFYQSNGYY